MSQNITAYFDSRTEAQNAIDKLAGIGITSADIRIADSSTTTTRGTTADEDKGFFEAIGDFFMATGNALIEHSEAGGVYRFVLQHSA